MVNHWIYISIIYICISGVHNDANHLSEVKEYLKGGQCGPEVVLGGIIRDYDSCIRNAISEIWTGFYENDGGVKLRDSLCRTGTLTACMSNTDSKLRDCYLPEKKDEAFVYALRSTNEAVSNYLCLDDAKELKRLLEIDAKNCINSVIDPVRRKCGEDAEINNINDVWFQKSFTSENFCMARGKWATCVLEILNQCPNKVSYEVIGKTFKAAFSKSPCKDTIHSKYPTLIENNANYLLYNYSLLFFSVAFTVMVSFLS